MKRIFAFVTMLVMAAALFTGCAFVEKALGKTSYEGTEYQGTVTLADDSYKNLSVDLSSNDYTVSAEDVADTWEQYREYMAETKELEEERPVADGDVVMIDFTGYVDGETFDGGSGTDYELEIGSHSFIDDFEEQLIGAEVGDEVKVEVTFPEGYGSDLGGKDALFEVTIKGIYEKVLPELTDEFANNLGYENIAAAETEIRNTLEENMMQQEEEDTMQALWAKVAEIATVEINEEDRQAHIEAVYTEYESYAAQNSMTLDEMLSTIFGITREDFNEYAEDFAEEQIKYYMIIQKLADEMGITVDEETYLAGYDKVMNDNGYDSEEEFSKDHDGKTFEEFYTRNRIVDDILAEAVMENLMENATITK